MQTAAPAATARYYEAFRSRYGFADSAMRGTGADLVRVLPVGPVEEKHDAGKYCQDGRNGKSADNRAAAAYARSMARRRVAEKSLGKLKDLIAAVDDRVALSRGAREALADAKLLLMRGLPADCNGYPLDVIASLTRILSRYA